MGSSDLIFLDSAALNICFLSSDLFCTVPSSLFHFLPLIPAPPAIIFCSSFTNHITQKLSVSLYVMWWFCDGFAKEDMQTVLFFIWITLPYCIITACVLLTSHSLSLWFTVRAQQTPTPAVPQTLTCLWRRTLRLSGKKQIGKLLPPWRKPRSRISASFLQYSHCVMSGHDVSFKMTFWV